MKLRPATLWPLAVIAALAVTVVANVAILIAASDPRKAGVEPDYYRKALAWDSTAAERGRSAALGWSIDARLAPDRGGARVHVTLAERDGTPLTGATVRIEAIHNLDPERPVAGLLVPTAAGAYEGRMPLFHHGLWELRFDVTRGRDRFVASLRRDRGGGG
jgi:nitrogen fixation protein FixH